MKTVKFLFLFCTFVVHIAWGSADQENWAKIELSIRDKMKSAQVSALQLSYVGSDGTQHDFSLGTTSLGGNDIVTSNTRFYSASLTKMFTAIALYQLREKGLLSFDDKITAHFPQLRQCQSPYMGEVTIKQILSHTSGMARNAEAFWSDPRLLAERPAPIEAEVFAASINQNFGVAPGTHLKYSNGGYEILGLLVGKLCVQCHGNSYTERYKDYVDKHILKRLQMTKSGFDPDRKLVPTFATPYQLIGLDGSRKPFPFVTSAGSSVGAWGLYSTSQDMIKFIQELGKIVSCHKNLLLNSDVADEVTTAILSDSLNSSFGHSLGFRLMKITDQNNNVGFLVGHTGTFPGYSSAAFYNTLDHSSSAVYFNIVDGGGIGYLMLLATPLSGITQVAGSSNFPDQVPQEPTPLNPFSGIVKKWNFMYGPIETIYENDRYFLLQSGQKLPLYLKISNDRLSIDGRIGTNSGYLDFIGDSIHFTLDENGNSPEALIANAIVLREFK